MATARSQIPVSNLRERIAALEQRNSGIGLPSPVTNGAPVPGSSSSTVPPATGFRDKIAKFERKGGVPVPRGSFGLGAPPAVGGPRRQGELYGNRIPAPVRAASVSMLPVATSRATSPTSTSGMNTPTGLSPAERRSFSHSGVLGDLDDGTDYTPITSPTFAFPPDSPDSTLSVSVTPEPSPSLPSNDHVTNFKRTAIRGTPFQKALEIARNTENAKQESQQAQQRRDEGATIPVVRQRPLDIEEEPLETTKPIPPAILLSSEEPVPVVVLDDSPTLEYVAPFDLNKDSVVTPTTPSTAPFSEISSIHRPESVELKEEIPGPGREESEVLPIDLDKDSVAITNLTPSMDSSSDASSVHRPESVEPKEIPGPGHTESSVIELPTDFNKDSVVITSLMPSIVSSPDASFVHRPESVEVKEEIPGRKEPSIAELPIVETVPSMIRKNLPQEPILEAEENKVPEFREPILPPAKIEDEKAAETPFSIPEPTRTPEPTIIISAPLPDPVAKPFRPLPQPSEVIILEEKKVVEAAAANLIPPETVETAPEPTKQLDTPKIRRLPDLPPPSIVVHNDQISTDDLNGFNKSSEILSRKAELTLDQDLLFNDSLMSPPAVSGSMSAMSLTDVLANYFTGGANGQQSFRTVTPPPLSAASPLSPMATLAYDNPETPPGPAKINAPDPQSLLSPPQSGFLSAVPSSGGSSMGSVSSLGSRPMSMIEMSPSRVTRAMRMTPATSVGVPVFLPPNPAGARKSDFVYFPPTPEAEEANFTSATLHKPSRSMSDLSDASAKQSTTFTAVVHEKVKETADTAASSQKPKRVPQTPQKAKRATILETPLSPGQGELAALLQGALWLEDSLDRGELPSDTPVDAADEEKLREEARRVAADAEAKANEEERKKIAIAKVQLQAKRDEPTSGRLKHTFLIPLTKARSGHHRKEATAPNMESSSNKPQDDSALRPKSAGLPDRSGARNAKAEPASASATQRTPPRPSTAESRPSIKPVESPPKASKTSRFASLRRLGSISRPSTIHGHLPRHSESMSSEDSAVVVTPPVNNLEFGTKKSNSPVNEFGRISANGSTTSFPSLSPKKSIHSISRATSFAERVWSRARTKSNGSSLSATSENTTEPPTLPSLNSPPAIEIPQLPGLLDDNQPFLHKLPRRSSSLRQLTDHRPTLSFEPLPIITTTPSQVQIPAQSSVVSPGSLLLPGSSDSTRSSWTSLSSAGSLPSPLFDAAIFDAFPSVPGTTPTPALTATLHHQNPNPQRPEKSVPITASAATKSFDTAFLSSAIHLVSSSNKRSPSPSAQSLSQSSRAATPTPSWS